MQAARRVKPEIEDCPPIEGLKVIRPKVFPDERGFFSETYNTHEWAKEIGFTDIFKQDNHSYSHFGVLRGLHAQPGMGKMVQVIQGEIYDVAVDIRKNSPTYGKYFGVTLNDKEKTCFWVPSGFLHGFQVLSESGAHVVYKCSSVYDPATEFGCNPFDKEIDVKWPLPADKCIVSDRDKAHPGLSALKNPFSEGTFAK